MKLNPIFGREKEQLLISNDIQSAENGKGKLIFIAGEAGMGKTRLAKNVAQSSNIFTISVSADERATPPYGLFVDLFRKFLRKNPNGFDEIGPLKPYLANLIPELGDANKENDQSSILESIRVAIELIANRTGTFLLLDDIQWADHATLEILPKLAEWIIDLPVVALCIYRNDEVQRGHPVRQIKNELRRANSLNEIIIDSLSESATKDFSKSILGSPISSQLADTIFYKTQGVPFFIEELIETMQEFDLINFEGGKANIISEKNIPLPENVRDAILLRFDKLSQSTQEYLKVASVVGQYFSFEIIDSLISHEEIEASLQSGFLVKNSAEIGQFRHALTKEAIYNEINWSKVKEFHRKVAEKLSTTSTPPELIAEHWLAAKDNNKARMAYKNALDNSCSIHAYSDAVKAAKSAIDLWPEGEEEMDRLAILDELGRCAQISGLLNESVKAWSEAAEQYLVLKKFEEYANIQRKLATVYGLQGMWDKSMESHRTSSDAFSKVEKYQDATSELLALIGHLHSAGQYNQALPHAENAMSLSIRGEDYSLQAKSMGFLGSLKTRIGFVEEGLSLAREGLSLALENNLHGTATELYIKIAAIMEHLGNYDEAQNTYDTSISYCETNNLSPYLNLCIACASVVSFQMGDFQEVLTLNNNVITSEGASSGVIAIAKSLKGLTQSLLGNLKSARENLYEALSISEKGEYLSLVLLCNWGLAITEIQENNIDAAKNHCINILNVSEKADESHYSINMLRFLATFFSSIGDGEHTRASADSLARIATTLSNYESLAGLAHGLGEVAWVNNDFPKAAEHFENAIDLLGDAELPLEEAETKYRAGLALIELSQTDKGMLLIANAFQLLQPTGEKFHTQKILDAVKEKGLSIEKLIGKRKAAKLKYGGLTRRQWEVLGLVAEGKTNQDIADALYLSIRTVDMHVSNVLGKLDCRTRTEAVNKANMLGILTKESI